MNEGDITYSEEVSDAEDERRAPNANIRIDTVYESWKIWWYRDEQSDYRAPVL